MIYRHFVFRIIILAENLFLIEYFYSMSRFYFYSIELHLKAQLYSDLIRQDPAFVECPTYSTRTNIARSPYSCFVLFSSNTCMHLLSLILDSNTKMTTEDRDLLACLPSVTTDTVHAHDSNEEEYEIRTLREPNLARLSVLPMYPTADEPSMQHLLLSNVPSRIFG